MRIRPPRPLVLQLITTLDPGGAEHQLLTLVQHLEARYRFMVTYLKGNGRLAARFPGSIQPPRAIDIRGRFDPGCVLRLARLLTDAQPALLVTHLFKADLYGALAAAVTGVPLVSHKHNEDQFLRHPVYGALGRVAHAHAARAITVSDAVRRFYVEQAGFPAGRLITIRHGIDGPAARQAVRIRDDAPTRELTLGTVARLAPQKGLPVLLQTVRVLVNCGRRVRLVVAGSGEDEAALRRQADQLGLRERVRFVGQVDDVAALIRSFDLFVLPSRWEGFGLVLLEAMAQSCPIVATCVGGIPEVVADGETGLLVPPEDVGALANAIGALIDDPSRRHALGRAGHARFRHRFTAERMAEETATVYDEAMAAGAGGMWSRGPRAMVAGGRIPAPGPAPEEVAEEVADT